MAPIAVSDVKTLSPPKPLPKWEIDGRLSLGFSFEEGNTEKDKFNFKILKNQENFIL